MNLQYPLASSLYAPTLQNGFCARLPVIEELLDFCSYESAKNEFADGVKREFILDRICQEGYIVAKFLKMPDLFPAMKRSQKLLVCHSVGRIVLGNFNLPREFYAAELRKRKYNALAFAGISRTENFQTGIWGRDFRQVFYVVMKVKNPVNRRMNFY